MYHQMLRYSPVCYLLPPLSIGYTTYSKTSQRISSMSNTKSAVVKNHMVLNESSKCNIVSMHYSYRKRSSVRVELGRCSRNKCVDTRYLVPGTVESPAKCTFSSPFTTIHFANERAIRGRAGGGSSTSHDSGTSPVHPCRWF